MSSRDKILGKLRSAQKPFEEVALIEDRRHMVPMSPELTQDELLARFTEEAKALSCYVYHLDNNAAIGQNAWVPHTNHHNSSHNKEESQTLTLRMVASSFSGKKDDANAFVTATTTASAMSKLPSPCLNMGR